MTIKDAYESLRKRQKALPAFEEIDDEFEISSLENELFLIRSIKRRMVERLEELAAMLGDILHPSAESMALMYEWRFFDPKEKKAVYRVYKRIQYFLRWFGEAQLIQNEDFDVKLMVEATKAWKELRRQSSEYAARLKEAWTKETEDKEELGYLG